MNYLKTIILIIALMLLTGGNNVMANDFIQENFVQIPSYLTDNNVDSINTGITPSATGITPSATCDGKCMDFCEHYDECCGYEKCMGSCQTCQTGCQVCQNCEGEACQTSQAPTNPANNTSLSISGISYTYFTATVTGIKNPTAISLHTKFYINNVFDGGVFSTTVSSVDHVYSGLSDGTTYSVKVTVENTSTGQIYKTFTRTVTTNERQTPKLPNPTLDTSKTIPTANSIKVTISTQSNVNKHYFRINNGTIINNGVVANYMFTNLTPNTQYFIEIKVGGSGYEDSDWTGYYATTLFAENWQWTVSERTAFNNNGETTALTYTRWNAFIDKIYATFLNDWRTSATDGAVLSYASTKMTSADKRLTADRFNSVRYNIDSRIATNISRVYTGNQVLGSYFIILETKLNQWIAGM